MVYRNRLATSPRLQRPLREINMIPLIDIMLVLLIVFMVTAPLITHAIKIKLPQVSSQPSQTASETVQLSIGETGELWWNREPVTIDRLAQRLLEAGATASPPALDVHADAQTPYHLLTRVMALVSKAVLNTVYFISLP